MIENEGEHAAGPLFSGDGVYAGVCPVSSVCYTTDGYNWNAQIVDGNDLTIIGYGNGTSHVTA